MHIWSTGSSHIDILSDTRPLAIPLHEVGSLPLSQFPHTSTGWQVSTFTNSTYHALYHPLYEIEDFMNEMARSYPDLVELVNLGHTGEGREMVAMKLSKAAPSLQGEGPYPNSVRKTGFVITGAQHAREVGEASSR